MKKIIYTAFMMLASFAMSAQVVTVNSIDKVNTNLAVDKPAISADGSFVVAYAGSQGAIVKITPDGQFQEIVKGEALYDLAVTGDGNSVVFSRPSFDKNHLRKVSLEVANLTTGNVNVVVKPTRDLNAGVSVSGSTVAAVENGRMRTKSVGSVKNNAAPIASISYGHLQVTVNGKTTTIDPQGRGSYLWPSVSPDGTKVVYWLVGGGCFVCDLDGSNAKSLGALRAPVFAGNDVVIGMFEKDNAEQTAVESSVLVACRIADNTLQRLTDKNIIAQYPAASADGSKVAFVTPEGQLYMMTLTK